MSAAFHPFHELFGLEGICFDTAFREQFFFKIFLKILHNDLFLLPVEALD